MTSDPMQLVDATKRDRRLMGMLCAGGVVSGVVTTLGASVGGQIAALVPSIGFGLMLAISLIVCAKLRTLRQVFFVIATSIAANLLAILSTGFLEIALSGQSWTLGHAVEPSVASLFVGGTLGASVVVLGVAGQVQSGTKLRNLGLERFYWSALGGILAIIGWKLGPSLGMGLWYAAHALRLTLPTETAQNAVGQTSAALSMYLVWQSGMGPVVGIALQRLSVVHAREVKQS